MDADDLTLNPGRHLDDISLHVGVGRERCVAIRQDVVGDHEGYKEQDTKNPGSRREEEGAQSGEHAREYVSEPGPCGTKPADKRVPERQPYVVKPVTASLYHAPQCSHALTIAVR